MKIALISEHASPLAVVGGIDSGGQNIYVAKVARHLFGAGHEVDVFTRCDRAWLPPVLEMEGVRVIHVPAGPLTHLPKERLLPYMDEFADYLLDFFQRERTAYDVVHANFFMSGLVGLRVKATLGIPLVITFHALGRVRRQQQGADDGFPDARFVIEERLAQCCDAVIAECPQDQADLISLYQAKPARITIVPCGFDSMEFHRVDRDIARSALGWPRNEFIILQLGRLVPRKGIDNVVRGVGVLKHDFGVAAHLYIVGGNTERPSEIATPEIDRLRGIARQCGVADQTTFVGRRGRSQLRLFYSAADVFVTTPWYEPFGITAIEAMACGIPVIGADVGGIRYSVKDGKTGWLVPPGDPAALAAKLYGLHQDRALARHMGTAGMIRAKTLFTWRGVVHSLTEVYRRVADFSPRVHQQRIAAPLWMANGNSGCLPLKRACE